ncbi:porin family protein [Ekhidna sp.]
MKKYLIFLTFLATFYFAKSQDIIVTTEGDTIDCKITRVGDEFIHFSIYDRSGVLLMRSRLPLSKIQHYDQAKPETVTQSPDIPVAPEEEIEFEEFEPSSFRLSINTGYTYQLGGYEGLPDSYKQQLQSLWNLGGELHYFITENFGVGAKYNHISTNADEDFQPPFSTAFGFSSLRDEKVTFDYIGLSFMYRNFLYDDQVVNYFIAGGVVKYRTDGLGDGVPFYQEGDTFGLVLGVNYDFIFVQNVGVGVGAEVNIASLKEFDNNGITVPADFTLTRIDLTVGVRFFK